MSKRKYHKVQRGYRKGRWKCLICGADMKTKGQVESHITKVH